MGLGTDRAERIVILLGNEGDAHVVPGNDPAEHERSFRCRCVPQRLWGDNGEQIAVHHWIGEKADDYEVTSE